MVWPWLLCISVLLLHSSPAVAQSIEAACVSTAEEVLSAVSNATTGDLELCLEAGDDGCAAATAFVISPGASGRQP